MQRPEPPTQSAFMPVAGASSQSTATFVQPAAQPVYQAVARPITRPVTTYEVIGGDVIGHEVVGHEVVGYEVAGYRK